VEVLGVREAPRSGKAEELMKAHGIDSDAIVHAARTIASD
jgi:transketolase